MSYKFDELVANKNLKVKNIPSLFTIKYQSNSFQFRKNFRICFILESESRAIWLNLLNPTSLFENFIGKETEQLSLGLLHQSEFV